MPGHQEQPAVGIGASGGADVFADPIQKQRQAAVLVEAEQSGDRGVALHSQRSFVDSIYAKASFDVRHAGRSLRGGKQESIAGWNLNKETAYKTLPFNLP